MKILTTIDSCRKSLKETRDKKLSIALVPTMGYLHQGHLSLIHIAKKKADIVFVSIFVNPLQFSPNEDFDKYPRDMKRDEELCEKAGVNYIFYPDVKEIFPDGFSTYVNAEGISSILEGAVRPGHFRGVATIVLKLFNIVNPDIAVFGQKDAQQLCIIKKMVNDLNVNIKIITGETVRESSGLALSSRNSYLSEQEKEDAAVLYKSLQFANQRILTGTTDFKKLASEMKKIIRSKQTVNKIDYISFSDEETLEEIQEKSGDKRKILISLAVRFGNVRLIDNIVIKG